MRRLLPILLILSWMGAGGAETVDSASVLTLFADTASTVVVEVPEGLAVRLLPRETPKDDASAAPADRPRQVRQWRVQVFSDNNKRTARGSAERRQQMVARRFPSMTPRVTYNAPYWKVSVGPFRTEADARAALQQLQAAFPGISREMRVTR